MIQRDGVGQLEYKVLQEKGPAHNREFLSRVSLNGEEARRWCRPFEKRSRAKSGSSSYYEN